MKLTKDMLSVGTKVRYTKRVYVQGDCEDVFLEAVVADTKPYTHPGLQDQVSVIILDSVPTVDIIKLSQVTHVWLAVEA